MIESYYTKEETWDRRNDLHTQAVELAGNDRALFFNGDFSRSRYVEMRFPEYVLHQFGSDAGHMATRMRQNLVSFTVIKDIANTQLQGNEHRFSIQCPGRSWKR